MSRLYVVSASTRPASAGRPLAQWVAELAREHQEFEATLIDLAEVRLPFHEEQEHPSTGSYVHQHTKDWSAAIDAADCFVFVMPMYNGGFSAALKNAIDYLCKEWQSKPVGLISYSSGTSGGAPAIEMLRPVLARVGLRPAATLSVPGIEHRGDTEGRFLAEPLLAQQAHGVLDSVADAMEERRAFEGTLQG
ncbi:NADPH-dependent FMN reductase [Streptomyces sp. NPDC059991]|uniref:NADPH-dependent FMN reductase n=1 Tax=Streptomyces sp. NPDC059991 TaxID=3347028 RepID=UPI00367B0524